MLGNLSRCYHNSTRQGHPAHAEVVDPRLLSMLVPFQKVTSRIMANAPELEHCIHFLIFGDIDQMFYNIRFNQHDVERSSTISRLKV
jgi:hypothetical protein